MDWHSRCVLGGPWRVFNTMDTGSCLEALKEALSRTGRRSSPEFPIST
jgi:putative transposase